MTLSNNNYKYESLDTWMFSYSDICYSINITYLDETLNLVPDLEHGLLLILVPCERSRANKSYIYTFQNHIFQYVNPKPNPSQKQVNFTCSKITVRVQAGIIISLSRFEHFEPYWAGNPG